MECGYGDCVSPGCRTHYADAYLAAQAELSGLRRGVSFDRRLERVKSNRRIEP